MTGRKKMNRIHDQEKVCKELSHRHSSFKEPSTNNWLNKVEFKFFIQYQIQLYYSLFTVYIHDYQIFFFVIDLTLGVLHSLKKNFGTK